jgi:dTDP-glucose pyrophosphorylase
MEEKLVQLQNTGVRQIMIFFLISEKFETLMRTGTAFSNNKRFKYQSVAAGYS